MATLSDGVPGRIFQKSLFLKKSADDKNMQNFSVGSELIGLFLDFNFWTVCCRDRDRERPPSRNTEDYKRNVYRDREYGRPNDRYERPRSRNGKIACEQDTACEMLVQLSKIF